MITWAEAAPQIAVALAIVAAVGFLLVLIFRQIGKLTRSLTRTNENGKPSSRIEAIEGAVESHGKLLVSHGKMHRKQFVVIAQLKNGQNEILEHLTGQPSTDVDVPEDIDAADTGEFLIADEGTAE